MCGKPIKCTWICSITNKNCQCLILKEFWPLFGLNNCNFDLYFLFLLKFEGWECANFADFDSVLCFIIRDWTSSNFGIIDICTITSFEKLIGQFDCNRKEMINYFSKSLVLSKSLCEKELIIKQLFLQLEVDFIYLIGF